MSHTDTYARTSRSAGCCLCLGFLLALFATVTPYWVWRYTYTYYLDSGSTSVGTGSFVTSYSSSEWKCPGHGCFVASSWNYHSAFNDTLCTQFYDKVNPYGFCDGNTFKVPGQLAAIQALSIIAAITSFAAGLSAMCAPTAGGAVLATFAGGCAVTSTLSSCASFAVAASYSWYQSFRQGSGGVLPLVTGNQDCNGGPCLFLAENTLMGYGPSFWAMVLCFVISLICSIFVLSVASKVHSKQDEAEGTYGQGMAYDDYSYVDDGQYNISRF